jgi:hypothetical protein
MFYIYTQGVTISDYICGRIYIYTLWLEIEEAFLYKVACKPYANGHVPNKPLYELAQS